MSTNEFEVHRSIVHSSNSTTGEVNVRIPQLLGAGQVVSIPTTGLKQVGGVWNVPSVGSTVFVAVSTDRTQFLWLTAIDAVGNNLLTNDAGVNYTNLADNDVLAYNSTTGVFENTSYLELTSLNVDGDITYNNNAIIASNVSSTNIDHIWHDDSTSNGLPGTWHFVSDREYKSAGSSMLEAGGARIPMRLSLSTSSNVTISDRTYAGGYIKMTSTSSRTVTVQSRPSGTYKQGDQITVVRESTGAVTFAVAAGSDNATIPTIKSRNGDVNISYRYSAATLICDSDDGTSWYLVGDLA